MTETLITFETAKLAKEKGFNEYCKNLYSLNTNNLIEDSRNKNTDSDNNHREYKFVSAPTQSLLQKWLRKFNDWPILVYVVPYLSKEPRKEQCFIWRRGNLITLEPKNTYEEALEEGLQEALKLIQL